MENKMKLRWDSVNCGGTDSLEEISKYIQEILEQHSDAKLDNFNDGESYVSYLEEINFSFMEEETDEEVAERIKREKIQEEKNKANDLRLYNEIKTKYNL